MAEDMQQTIITLGLSEDILEKIKDYQHANRIPSRTEAIRRMIRTTYDDWVAKRDTNL